MARFHLNGKPLFVKGVLDQGYWPDGLMTAPDDEALTYDITAMKNAGFNMLRKHQKIESARWYYHCDRLGMLVWQDAVSGGGTDGEYNAWTTNRKPTLIRSMEQIPRRHRQTFHGARRGRPDLPTRLVAYVRRDGAHARRAPSIVTWTLFNEGWGQFDACDAAERIHALDPTRPIDATSGWYDQRCGDFHSVHNYFRPLEIYPDKGPLRGYVAEFEKKHRRRRRAAHYVVLPVARHGVRAFVISNSADWRSSYRSMRRCRAPTVTVNTIRSTIGGPPCVPCSPPRPHWNRADLRDTCIRRFPTWRRSSTAC